MTRLLTALVTCVGLIGVAHAQTTVTIFGVVDASATAARAGEGMTAPAGGGVRLANAPTLKRLDSGVGPGSRLGFRGTEDLGDGLRAIFHLEHGFDTSTGTPQQLGVFWGRQIFVGLQSTNYSITAGRQLSPMVTAIGAADVMGGVYWGNSTSMTGNGLYASLGEAAGSGFDLATGRVDNSVMVSGTAGPFVARLMVGAGNENSRGTGRLINPSVHYSQGPILLTASYTRFRQGAASLTATGSPEWLSEAFIGGQYSGGWGKLGAGYYRTTGPKDLTQLAPSFLNSAIPGAWRSSSTSFLGASTTFGTHRIAADISLVNFKYPSLDDGRTTVFSGVWEYYLSKRSNLYLSVATLKNNENARSPLIAAIPAIVANGYGSRVSATSLGIRHQF